jgi:hypothetical protein
VDRQPTVEIDTPPRPTAKVSAIACANGGSADDAGSGLSAARLRLSGYEAQVISFGHPTL